MLEPMVNYDDWYEIINARDKKSREFGKSRLARGMRPEDKAYALMDIMSNDLQGMSIGAKQLEVKDALVIAQSRLKVKPIRNKTKGDGNKAFNPSDHPGRRVQWGTESTRLYPYRWPLGKRKGNTPLTERVMKAETHAEININVRFNNIQRHIEQAKNTLPLSPLREHGGKQAVHTMATRDLLTTEHKELL